MFVYNAHNVSSGWDVQRCMKFYRRLQSLGFYEDQDDFGEQVMSWQPASITDKLVVSMPGMHLDIDLVSLRRECDQHLADLTTMWEAEFDVTTPDDVIMAAIATAMPLLLQLDPVHCTR